MRRVVLLALALSLQTGVAAAQEMRPFTTFRQLHGETRLHASLEYAAGALRVAPGRPTELYRMDLAFDGERFAPISDYDAAQSAVSLGLRRGGTGGVRVVSRGQLQQSANIAFAPSTELDLALNLGAVDADLELGGLRLASLDLQTGASRSVVRFSRPNATRCRSPPDSFTPRSPTSVSYPFGSRMMKSWAFARAAACSISAREAVGRA